MPRWEPDTEERLRRAAVELFIEHGYEAVTVSNIAERAGLTRRSFFRYFPDKREVLFSGSSRLTDEIEHRLESVGADESTGTVLASVLIEAGTILMEDRAAQLQRRAIIASSPELQERDRAKSASIGAAIGRSMMRHGMNPADAELLGAIWAEVFRSAYDRALSDSEALGFGHHISGALRVSTSFAGLAAADDASPEVPRK